MSQPIKQIRLKRDEHVPSFQCQQQLSICVELPENSRIQRAQASFQYITDSETGLLTLLQGERENGDHYITLREIDRKCRKAAGKYRLNTFYVCEENVGSYQIVGVPRLETVALKIFEGTDQDDDSDAEREMDFIITQ